MDSQVIEVRTGGDFACADLTPEVQRFVAGKGDGLCNVFVPHATAGIAVFELGAGTEADVERVFQQVLPRVEGRWSHRHGSAGHGADHVLPLLAGPSLVIPVVDGRLALGTWQSVVLVDTNVDNPVRRVRLSFLTG